MITVTVALAIGDSYGGGKVAYIFQSVDPGYVAGEQHGLIAATADQNGGAAIAWSNIHNIAVGATAQGTAIGTGQANTTAIVAQRWPVTCTSGAAWLCNDLTEGGYSDWYLPSKGKLNKLYINQFAIGGFADYPGYWTSSEVDAENAWGQWFDGGVPGDGSKDYERLVGLFGLFNHLSIQP